MTGMTSRGILSQKLKHDYVALSDVLSRALLEMGHEVDAGRVTPGEDLDRYDAALVLTYWVSSLSSHYCHEAAWALSELGPRAVCYVDDWRSQTLADDYQNHVERPVGWERHRGRFRKNLWDTLTPDQEEAGRRALLSFIDPSMGRAPTIIVPQHPWGDLSRWQTGGRELLSPLVALDPTPGVPLPELARRPDGERERRWVLATIQEHDRWLARDVRAAWPVLQLGGAKKLGGGVNPGRTEMGKVVSEREVVQAYADSWGMLVPPYACSGSGWWRPRYTYAAHARAVTYAPLEDAERLGESFMYGVDQIEGMTTAQLASLADEQRAVQESHAMSKARMYEVLESTLVAASRASS